MLKWKDSRVGERKKQVQSTEDGKKRHERNDRILRRKTGNKELKLAYGSQISERT